MGKVATEATLQGVLDEVKSIGQYTKYIATKDDSIFAALLKGGADYKTVMRSYFKAHGGDALTDLSELCDSWYTLTRPGWHGGVRFDQPQEGVAASSDGTKTGDNANMVCIPSTTTEANRDDYASNPLFACVDCNVYVDEAGKPHVTAIDGIAGNFERYNPKKIVAVMQMTGWFKCIEQANVYGFDYTDEPNLPGYQPLPEAVELADNSVRSWVVHGKYGFGGTSSDSGWGCYSGAKPHLFNVSYNSQLTGIRNAWGNQYCGLTSADDAFIKRMLYLKYGQLDSDRVLAGCTMHNLDYPIAVAETGVERVILTTKHAANLIVGSTISVGEGKRKWNAENDCSVCDFVKITSIEPIIIDGTTYAALYVDNGGVIFDTNTSNYVIEYQWFSGATDDVLGNDGGINPKIAKYSVKIQGIEILSGYYEAFGDMIFRYETVEDVKLIKSFVCRNAKNLSTSINSNYIACEYGFPCPEVMSWTFPKRMGYDKNLPEIMLGIISGGSSTTGPRDAYYIEQSTIKEGAIRAGLRLGHLAIGSALAGLSSFYGVSGTSSMSGGISGRLSVTGNRGKFSA